eukprot:3505327-Lingulodinium_polyedra.AAC.1
MHKCLDLPRPDVCAPLETRASMKSELPWASEKQRTILTKPHQRMAARGVQLLPNGRSCESGSHAPA